MKKGEEWLTGEKNHWIRGLIGSIPTVGSAIDHLVFTRADNIRQKNFTLLIESLRDEIFRMREENVDKEWFLSEEFLQILSKLLRDLGLESDQNKVVSMGQLLAQIGHREFDQRRDKASMVSIISSMTFSQQLLSWAIYKMEHRRIPHPTRVSEVSIKTQELFPFLKKHGLLRYFRIQSVDDVIADLDILHSMSVIFYNPTESDVRYTFLGQKIYSVLAGHFDKVFPIKSES